MIELVYSPMWFYGKDIIIDIVSIFVLILIAFFSLKYYRYNKKNKNYLILSSSFFIIALSFLFKILTNFSLYYNVLETKNMGFVTFTYQTIRSTDTLFFIGFFLYRLLTLFGLFILFNIYEKKKGINTILLISYLLMISTYFSQSAYYIFHITSLLLLAIITIQYYKNSGSIRSFTPKLLAVSFAVIALSQILFIFIRIDLIYYVIAEIVQLVGYILLLITFMVLKYGKKKQK